MPNEIHSVLPYSPYLAINLISRKESPAPKIGLVLYYNIIESHLGEAKIMRFRVRAFMIFGRNRHTMFLPKGRFS